MKRRGQGWTGRKYLPGRKKARRGGSQLWRAQMNRYPVAASVWGGARRQISWRQAPPRLVSASLLIVAGWLLYWFCTADTFYIHGARIEGNWRLPDDELLALSGLEGVNVFWADTQAAVLALEALPDVKSARISCSLPANCVISVVERKALLVWRQGEAQVWVGADGVAVRARGDLPNAVVLDAAGSKALMPGDRLDATLVSAVGELEQLQPSVRVYGYADHYGLSFRNARGWLVRLGNGEDVATHLALLRTLTEYLVSQGIEPALIDVRYLEAPYYEVQ